MIDCSENPFINMM